MLRNEILVIAPEYMSDEAASYSIYLKECYKDFEAYEVADPIFVPENLDKETFFGIYEKMISYNSINLIVIMTEDGYQQLSMQVVIEQVKLLRNTSNTSSFGHFIVIFVKGGETYEHATAKSTR